MLLCLGSVTTLSRNVLLVGVDVVDPPIPFLGHARVAVFRSEGGHWIGRSSVSELFCLLG